MQGWHLQFNFSVLSSDCPQHNPTWHSWFLLLFCITQFRLSYAALTTQRKLNLGGFVKGTRLQVHQRSVRQVERAVSIWNMPVSWWQRQSWWKHASVFKTDWALGFGIQWRYLLAQLHSIAKHPNLSHVSVSKNRFLLMHQVTAGALGDSSSSWVSATHGRDPGWDPVS